MYDFFIKNFGNYIIEDSKEHLIYLINGEKLASQFDWYGEQRAEAFNIFKTNPLKSDIEERDIFYTHMIIWDKENMEIVGGQRFLFNKKGCIQNKDISYLEEFHKARLPVLERLAARIKLHSKESTHYLALDLLVTHLRKRVEQLALNRLHVLGQRLEHLERIGRRRELEGVRGPRGSS